MTPEGLAGTGIGGRTPLTGWGSVQIGDVWRIGRLLGVGVASRFGLYGGLDASGRLAWRPDLGGVGRIGRQSVVGVASRFLVVADLDACWVLARRPDCVYRVIWTPVVNNRGVQIGNLGRNGRHLRTGAASRLGI